MPSPIAHCKQSVALLVVSLFLLGCVVPSSVGSTVDIRRQSEENNDLSKQHGKKKTKTTSRFVYPAPAEDATHCPPREFNQRPLNYRCSVNPLDYWPSLTNSGSGMGFIVWSKLFPQKILRHAATWDGEHKAGWVITKQGGECLPGALLFYQLSRLQPQIYPLMEKPLE